MSAIDEGIVREYFEQAGFFQGVEITRHHRLGQPGFFGHQPHTHAALKIVHHIAMRMRGKMLLRAFQPQQHLIAVFVG